MHASVRSATLAKLRSLEVAALLHAEATDDPQLAELALVMARLADVGSQRAVDVVELVAVALAAMSEARASESWPGAV